MDTADQPDSRTGTFSTNCHSFASRSFRNIAAITIFLLAFAATSFAQSSPYYLWTGQSSAQTQIDSFHTSSWYIQVVNGPVLLGGGNFTMKDGSSASADVTLTLYQGGGTSGSVLASVTRSEERRVGKE